MSRLFRLGGRYLTAADLATGAFIVLFVIAALTMFVLMGRRSPAMPDECRQRYARAATARDTAIVDEVRLGLRAADALSCGVFRRMHAPGAGAAH